jgi:hypothetical protein
MITTVIVLLLGGVGTWAVMSGVFSKRHQGSYNWARTQGVYNRRR